MKKVFKKVLSFLGCMFFWASYLPAQQNHFIYIQTENKQPFYIKLDKTIFSSTASGYVIIPKLPDSTYTLAIGFPKNEWPEQKVTCSINKKDAGYVLKNFGDKGWGLFNLQTMEVLMPEIKPDSDKNSTADTRDIFSNTLSNVVNDPSIIKRIENKPPVKEAIIPAAATEIKETVATEKVKKEEPIKIDREAEPIKVAGETEKKDEPIKVVAQPEHTEETKKPVVQITRLLSISNAEGTDMVYTDIVNGKVDTIRLFIPEENGIVTSPPEKKTETVLVAVPKKEEQKMDEPKKELVQKEAEKQEAVKKDTLSKEEPKKEEIIMGEPKKESLNIQEDKKELIADNKPVNEVPKPETINKETTKNNTPKFIDIEVPNPNSKKDTTVKPQLAAVQGVEEKKATAPQVPEKPRDNQSKPLIANSDCKNFASDGDFLKLRKKMAAEEKDDDMLDISRKAFRSKCFTTEQVKNLSVLFLKDEGKYKFFDMAYPFVSDSYNFGTLEGQLSDSYFIARFKAMIHH